MKWKEGDRTEESQEKRNKANLTLSMRSLSLIRYVGGDALMDVETVEKKLAKSKERDGASLTSESPPKGYIFNKQFSYYEKIPATTPPLPFFKKACNSYQNKVIMMKKVVLVKGSWLRTSFSWGEEK